MQFAIKALTATHVVAVAGANVVVEALEIWQRVQAALAPVAARKHPAGVLAVVAVATHGLAPATWEVPMLPGAPATLQATQMLLAVHCTQPVTEEPASPVVAVPVVGAMQRVHVTAAPAVTG